MKKAVLPLLAAVMVLTAAAAPSLSYFTTYVSAQGGKRLALVDVEHTPHEQVTANTKSIQVGNTGETPCYVRVKLVYASDSGIGVTYTEGSGWFPGGDGYYYYSEVLPAPTEEVPEPMTTVLDAALSIPTEREGKKVAENTEVNVVVVTESAPVLYDANGVPEANGPDYRGWKLQANKEG